jgi:hypothetical protein
MPFHHTEVAGPRVIFRATTSPAPRKLPHRTRATPARSGYVTIVRVKAEQGKSAPLIRLRARPRQPCATPAARCASHDQTLRTCNRDDFPIQKKPISRPIASLPQPPGASLRFLLRPGRRVSPAVLPALGARCWRNTTDVRSRVTSENLGRSASDRFEPVAG